MRKKFAWLVIIPTLALMGCVANRSSAPTAEPSTQQLKNLQVLPATMTRDEVVATMRRITRSLGVRCDQCHVRVGEDFDFPSDAKEDKRTARLMMRMTRMINESYISKVTHEREEFVTCYTCHRGQLEPVTQLPPEPPKNDSGS